MHLQVYLLRKHTLLTLVLVVTSLHTNVSPIHGIVDYSLSTACNSKCIPELPTCDKILITLNTYIWFVTTEYPDVFQQFSFLRKLICLFLLLIQENEFTLLWFIKSVHSLMYHQVILTPSQWFHTRIWFHDKVPFKENGFTILRKCVHTVMGCHQCVP
jgi:hypothetical protein